MEKMILVMLQQMSREPQGILIQSAYLITYIVVQFIITCYIDYKIYNLIITYYIWHEFICKVTW